MTATHDTVLVTRDGAVLVVTFNRPQRLNAFTLEDLRRTAEVLADAAQDSTVRTIVLTGAGRAFSAGADLGDQQDQKPALAMLDAANDVARAIRATPQPIVAAVNGPAIGVGCSLALAADIVVARESSYFLLPFTDLGLMPDGGATALLPAAVGRARAIRLTLLAERLPAATAHDWGLISFVTAETDFEDKVADIVAKLASGPSAAYAHLKRALDAGALAGFEQALETERAGQEILSGTADFTEGVDAFRQRRKPRFSGQ
ncbi:enoyl-CoA hydratase [Nocardia sp. NPDC059239]|uniref:enoyl-CoA hydratase n=1 Tax=unclassified Nocardia TaxID=2637762 RepID=UPI0036D2040C